MPHFKESILNCLKDLKGSGKFVSAHTADFIFPGLAVTGLGEIAYPVNEDGAKALIAAAKRAPFGKGSDTIVDSNVRNTWEIDAAGLSFNNPRWADFLNEAIRNIKPGLGLEGHEISAHLYKMLIYEKGSFFLPHRDSEKEKGMFGTLVIELPANHTGGELVVTFEGTQELVSFAQDSGNYRLRYAAFYADCEHEIKPVTSGYRVCLVYNLIQQGPGKKIAPASIEKHAAALAEILKAHQQREDAEPAIILLGHQYTPENFSADALKLNDRPKAEALLQAAKKAGYYSRLCLVTSYLAGSPEGGGGYYDYDEDDSDDAVMDEVHDESLSIEHWAESGIPPLSHVSFEEADLIASAPLNEGEPIIKENTGYMGNYGPDLMHWYHYGAVMIWSPETNARLLLQQNTASKLEWIGYLAQARDGVTARELAAVTFILSTGFGNSRADKEVNYNLVADWIIHEGDGDFLLRIPPAVTQSYFTRIDAAHWVKLIQFFGEKTSSKIFALAERSGTMEVLEQLLAILRALPDSGQFDRLLSEQVALLPLYFSEVLTAPQHAITAAGLNNLFWIEAQKPRPAAWVNSLANLLTQHADRDYIHHVLAPGLLALMPGTPLPAALLAWCGEYMQRLVASLPQPPADWSREMPAAKYHQKEWALLKAFLESPREQVFDYRKNQSERNEMESAIRNVVIDLKTETIKKGLPHTLRIIKTQAAYQRQLKSWNEDEALLNRIMQKTAEGSIWKGL